MENRHYAEGHLSAPEAAVDRRGESREIYDRIMAYTPKDPQFANLSIRQAINKDDNLRSMLASRYAIVVSPDKTRVRIYDNSKIKDDVFGRTRYATAWFSLLRMHDSNLDDGRPAHLKNPGKLPRSFGGHSTRRFVDFPLPLDAPTKRPTVKPKPYGIENIANQGCFLDRVEIGQILARLRDKQNLILQGPPGTGKTWLAKRLAFALMGEKAGERVKTVQFHPTLSYEDFVRGWRPKAQVDGRSGLELADGAFMRMVQAATQAPHQTHVLVIEEINRGNPAQIFGEMLTLLENSKRSAADAMELAYPRPGERVHVPANLYVIGTMNLADRSLAMVDLALRRRFAFHTLAPQFNAAWQKWLAARGVDEDTAEKIRAKMEALNATIAADPELGAQFCVGHSYVTPRTDEKIADAKAWFRAIVDSEIAPLLEEYWHDNSDKAEKETAKLLAGF